VSADREALAASQSSLLDALLDGGVPAGFDPRGVGVAARGLLLKRRRSVARAWPGLALALGQGFGPLFAAYAKKHDLPAGGALVDGRLFARELKRAGNLPPEALPYLLEFDLVRAIRGGVVVERRLPGVRMAAVVAMPDAVMGERGCAFVVAREGAALTLGELTDYLLQRQIAKFKLPERLELVDAMPVTAMGKVSKKALREMIAAKLAAEAPRTP